MEAVFDVIGLGTVVIDHLVVLPSSPETDSKTVVLEDRFQVGGPVPTALVLLRRLGRRCSFVGSWGGDPFGEMIESDFGREGLDFGWSNAGGLRRTGFSHVWVDGVTGSRTIACHRPDAEGLAIWPGLRAALASCRVLHLDGWPGRMAIEAARIVRKSGGTVVLDTGSPKPEMDELLDWVDVVNCPQRFIEQFLETDDLMSGAQAMLERGPRMVTITSGSAGALLATEAGVLHRPAFLVEVLDTTGAGDCFCGGLIHGLLGDASPEGVLSFAMGAAAVKCRGIGNRDALGSAEQIHELVEAQPMAADGVLSGPRYSVMADRGRPAVG